MDESSSLPPLPEGATLNTDSLPKLPEGAKLTTSPELTRPNGGIGSYLGGQFFRGGGETLKGLGDLTGSKTLSDIGQGDINRAAEFEANLPQDYKPNVLTRGLGTIANMAAPVAGTAVASLANPVAGIAAGSTLFGSQGYEGSKEGEQQRIAAMQQDELAKAPRYNELLKSGLTPEQAKAQFSQEASEHAGKVGGTVGAVLGLAGEIPGVGALSRAAGSALVRPAARVLGGDLARPAARIAGEAVGGAAGFSGLNAAGQIAQNVTDYVPTDTFQGVPEAAGEGLLPGAILHGTNRATAEAGARAQNAQRLMHPDAVPGSLSDAANELVRGVDQRLATPALAPPVERPDFVVNSRGQAVPPDQAAASAQGGPGFEQQTQPPPVAPNPPTPAPLALEHQPDVIVDARGRAVVNKGDRSLGQPFGGPGFDEQAPVPVEPAPPAGPLSRAAAAIPQPEVANEREQLANVGVESGGATGGPAPEADNGAGAGSNANLRQQYAERQDRIDALNAKRKTEGLSEQENGALHDLNEQQAQTNPMTGLPNKTAFQQAEQDPQYTHTVAMDARGFKSINDAHGHNAGDEVLQVIGQHLAEHFADDPTVRIFHTSGDEFPARTIGDQTAKIQAATSALEKKPFSLQVREKDGSVHTVEFPGIKLDFGVGKNLDEADANAVAAKESAAASGEYTRRTSDQVQRTVRPEEAQVAAGADRVGDAGRQDNADRPAEPAAEPVAQPEQKTQQTPPEGGVSASDADLATALAKTDRATGTDGAKYIVAKNAEGDGFHFTRTEHGEASQHEAAGDQSWTREQAVNAASEMAAARMQSEPTHEPALTTKTAPEDAASQPAAGASDVQIRAQARVAELEAKKRRSYNEASELHDLKAAVKGGDAAEMERALGSRATTSAANFVRSSAAPGWDKIEAGGASSGRKPMSRDALAASIAKTVRGWQGDAPRVQVLQSHTDAPPALRNARGFGGDVEGAYHNGTVYMFADALRSPKRALQVLAHEAIGHFGMERAFGDVWPKLVKDIGALREKAPAYMRKVFEQVDRRYPGADAETHASETLAVMAEKGIHNALMDRVLATMRKFLRSLGFDLKFSDAELRQMLVAAKRRVEGEKDTGSERQAQPAFSKAEKTDSPEFKRWFGDSKVETGDKPTVVYHGTGEDFNVFEQNKLGESTQHATAPLGFHFTTDRVRAEHYAENASENRPANERVISAYLKVENPYRMKLSEAQAIETPAEAKALRTKLEAAGHDGIQIPEAKTWIAFKPEQVKSVDNRGSFDASNPDIRFSKADKEDEAAKPTLAERARAAVPESIKEPLGNIVDDLLHKAAPMATGSDEARATSKDFANALRLARHEGSVADEFLKRNFAREQRNKMWRAADEQSVLMQRGEDTKGKGLDALNPKERAAVEDAQKDANTTFQESKELGMVEGEGLPSYAPRMVVEMAAKGAQRVGKGQPSSGAGGAGANVKTGSPNLNKRMHETTADTIRAAQAKFGENATVVEDIRTLPLATARLKEANAGRRLINQIRDIGKAAGADTVREGSAPANEPGKWFTIPDHPAFQTWRGSKDAEGNTTFEKVPLFIRSDFKGPLNAVMSPAKPGAIYSGLMRLKAGATSVIMYSPIIHNAVEWGRALPAMPGKVLTFRVYFDGNKAKNDPATMREAIKAGLSPIGGHGAYQDITGIANEPQIQAGRSLFAKTVGALLDHTTGGGEKARDLIDKAGDFWHNTLLWDRVGDLQMGLYTNLRDSFMKKGMDATSAQRVAAHMANRYAGSLPAEAMSNSARKIANLMLFSRSFTLGNLGAMKDAVTGLPKDVQSQILRDSGEMMRKAAVSVARRKAIATVMLDVGLMYIGNSLLQSALAVMSGRSDLDKEEQGYARRFNNEMQAIKENPLKILTFAKDISATADNEPGRDDRVLVGHSPDGTAIYMRNPTGKIGEEFTGWLTSPLDMLKKKQGTIARPLYETITNDKGFGRKLYNPYADTPKEWMKNLGRIAENFIGDQLPTQSIAAAKDYFTGHGDAQVNLAQAVGPLAGITFSKGAPGGEAVGEMYAAKDRHEYQIQQALPDIRRQIQEGDIAGARAAMKEVEIPVGYQNWIIKTTKNPRLRLSPSQMKQFGLYATPEQKERMKQAQGGH